MISPNNRDKFASEASLEKAEESFLKAKSTGNLLPKSVLPNEDKFKDGKLLNSMINYGFGFTPDLAFENLVKDYSMAEKLYGKTFLRQLTGYDSRYLKKNLMLPEFKRTLKKRIKEKHDELKKKRLLDGEGELTEEGVIISGLALYLEELDSLVSKGYGEKINKKNDSYGDVKEIVNYKRAFAYKDIAVRSSVRTALKRRHTKLVESDLRVKERQAKGKINVIYAFDTSGSMKGKKIEMAKKAGIALIYKAISNKDKVGLVIFHSDIAEKIAPSDNFLFLLNKITKARASKQTNVADAITTSIYLYPQKRMTKHLILITDALPTIGNKPEKESLDAAALANNHGITISLVGINLEKQGLDLAKKIVELGKGRLHLVKDINELDKVVLEEYYKI